MSSIPEILGTLCKTFFFGKCLTLITQTYPDPISLSQLQATRHYELLNYSEHGTTVDNVLYSCDFSEKAVTASQPSNLVSSVKKIIKSQKKEKDSSATTVPSFGERETMAAHAYVVST